MGAIFLNGRPLPTTNYLIVRDVPVFNFDVSDGDVIDVISGEVPIVHRRFVAQKTEAGHLLKWRNKTEKDVDVAAWIDTLRRAAVEALGGTN